MANLETKNLSAGYRTKAGEVIVFKDTSLSLEPGRLVCFMGPNGSGKSTLLRTIAGLQPPLSGEIQFPNARHTSLVERVSVVLTEPVVVPHMTVSELVTLGRYPWLGWNLSLSVEDIAIVDNAISRVNIAHLANKDLDVLSDGQKQMAMIARALAQDTCVLLLDEPTSHLDLDNRVEIMRLLRSLARTTSKSILIATHELDLALQTADVLWLASANKTISTGTPEDLVLNGSIDAVFRFKGFDLKTGKINQDTHRGVSIRLTGDGHAYRWTRNALERCGYEIDASAAIIVSVSADDALSWTMNSGTYASIADLLAAIKALTAVGQSR